MSEEETIENLRKQLIRTKEANECGLATKGEFKEEIEAIETILNMLEDKEQKIRRLCKESNQLFSENEKKDKIIDKMAEQLEGEPIFEDFKPKPIIIENKKEVINYFSKKVNI